MVYNHSKIAAKITLGRTKASAIAYNVLAPASIETAIKELTKGVYFSISTDASNHGSVKLFPILVRYYLPGEDLKLRLFDFFDDPDESANKIFLNLKTRMEKLGLNLKHVSSYSADNANVNFGRHHSVYQLLRQENPKILAGSCPAHMINNAVKYGLEKCTLDVENLVLKI